MFAASTPAATSLSDVQGNARNAEGQGLEEEQSFTKSTDSRTLSASSHEDIINVHAFDIDAMYGLDATTGEERFGIEGFENVKGGLLQMGVEIGPKGEIRYVDKDWSKVPSVNERDDLTKKNAGTMGGVDAAGSMSEGGGQSGEGDEDDNSHNVRIHKRQLIDDDNDDNASNENVYVEIVNRHASNVIKRMQAGAIPFLFEYYFLVVCCVVFFRLYSVVVLSPTCCCH